MQIEKVLRSLTARFFNVEIANYAGISRKTVATLLKNYDIPKKKGGRSNRQDPTPFKRYFEFLNEFVNERNQQQGISTELRRKLDRYENCAYYLEVHKHNLICKPFIEWEHHIEKNTINFGSGLTASYRSGSCQETQY